MKIKHISLTLLSALAAFTAKAQDLSSKIPSNSEFIVSVNNKAILQNASLEVVNDFIGKMGLYKALSTGHESIHSVDQLPLDLQKNAYLYKSVTDSISYMVALLPLQNTSNFPGELFPKDSSLTTQDGYQVSYLEDKQCAVVYNDDTLMVVYPFLRDSFFEQEHIMERYALEPMMHDNYWDYDYSNNDQDQELEWQAHEFEQEQVHVPGCEHYQEPSEGVGNHYESEESSEHQLTQKEQYGDAIKAIAVAQDPEDYVDYQGAYDAQQATQGVSLPGIYNKSHNELVLDSLSKGWLIQALPGIINPESILSQSKQVLLKDNTTLARFWVRDFNSFYFNLLGNEMDYDPFGMNLYAFKSGYDQLKVDLIAKDNVLRLYAEGTMDKEFSTYAKKVLKHKMNPKIKKYIPADNLGYVSINFNAQEYIQRTPAMFYKQYGKHIGEYQDILLAVTTALEVTLNSKGIAKMLPGDMVVFINDVQNVTKKYTSYEWDEDYNLVEQELEKQVNEPQFLAIGSSEDQRLFKALLQIGVNKNEFSLDEQWGIYSLPENSDMMDCYIYFKDDLVFVGSDLAQMVSIAKGTFKGDPLNKTRKELGKNLPVNVVLHISKLKDVLQDLDIPVDGTLEELPNLEYFGDLKLHLGLKGSNKIYSELSVSFPAEKNSNALSYILNQISKNFK